jgi:hypothetical protein
LGPDLVVFTEGKSLLLLPGGDMLRLLERGASPEQGNDPAIVIRCNENEVKEWS